MPTAANRCCSTVFATAMTAAFTDLVTRYGGPMLAVARRILGNEEDARDCVQDALIAAAAKIEKFEGRSKLSTWLHRIVVNMALSQLRRRARRPEQSIEPLMPNFDTMGCRIELPEADYLSLDEAIDRTKSGHRGARRHQQTARELPHRPAAA